jgi:hypothetical protein
MKTLFDKPLERRKVRESVAVDDASPPSHNNNTQQSSSKPPLLIQNLQATSSNETASEIGGLRKPAPSARGQLRSVRTTRASASVRDIDDHTNGSEVAKFSKQVGLGKPWPRLVQCFANGGHN